LVGNGAEIIAVDCQLYYKINNLFKYVTKVQNPKSYIEAITYKILTAKTVSQTFDQIMSQNRHNFASELKKEVQEQLDKEDFGITIVDLMFLAIHPPVEVAEAYEDVISAQVDKQTYILKQESESTKEICMKKAFAYDAIAKSKSYAVTTVSNAVGEAVAFEKKVIAFNTEPELERFRLRLDSILKVSKSKNLYVIDKSIMRKNDRIILNLQN
jgi:regulator of protease activity HflC (stomatin/prohibitin superfamily)